MRYIFYRGFEKRKSRFTISFAFTSCSQNRIIKGTIVTDYLGVQHHWDSSGNLLPSPGQVAATPCRIPLPSRGLQAFLVLAPDFTCVKVVVCPSRGDCTDPNLTRRIPQSALHFVTCHRVQGAVVDGMFHRARQNREIPRNASLK